MGAPRRNLPAQPLAVGLGEILWDMLPDGPRLGGAPANFAFHARQLGAEARVVSRVGDDELGREALRRLAMSGLDVSCVDTDPDHPTGQALAVVEKGIARYEFPDDSAWDHLAMSPAAEALAERADAMCFGTLAQRSPASRAMIRDFLSRVRTDGLKILDPNLRGGHYDPGLLSDSLGLADVLKFSDEELVVFSDVFGLAGSDAGKLASLLDRFGLRLAAMTHGSRGALLVAPGEVSEHAGTPVEVEDTIGAGDSFTAALALGLLAGWPLDAVNDQANRAAAAVCGGPGGMARIDPALRIF